MDATALYLSTVSSDTEFTAILVGVDLSECVKDAINIYDLDMTVSEVLEAFEANEYSSASIGKWHFESAYLGEASNLVLKMSEVNSTNDDWRESDE